MHTAILIGWINFDKCSAVETKLKEINFNKKCFGSIGINLFSAVIIYTAQPGLVYFSKQYVSGLKVWSIKHLYMGRWNYSYDMFYKQLTSFLSFIVKKLPNYSIYPITEYKYIPKNCLKEIEKLKNSQINSYLDVNTISFIITPDRKG